LRALRGRVKGALDELVTVVDGVEHIDPRRLRELASSWPSHIDADRAMGVYAQLTRAAEPLLVVNTITGGHGRGRGRVRPPAARFLSNAFGAPAYLLGPYHPLLRPTPPLPGDGQVRAVPRLQVGNVVVRRASWTAWQNTLPHRQPGGSDTEWMLRMLSWLR